MGNDSIDDKAYWNSMGINAFDKLPQIKGVRTKHRFMADLMGVPQTSYSVWNYPTDEQKRKLQLINSPFGKFLVRKKLKELGYQLDEDKDG